MSRLARTSFITVLRHQFTSDLHCQYQLRPWVLVLKSLFPFLLGYSCQVDGHKLFRKALGYHCYTHLQSYGRILPYADTVCLLSWCIPVVDLAHVRKLGLRMWHFIAKAALSILIIHL